jgi:hypothetical membrane protein
MEFDYGRVAGAVLFIGAVQFLIMLIVSEALYPGYSVANNYISDLGVGSSALIFNSSVFLLGVTIVAGAYLIRRAFNSKIFVVLLILAGVGAMGVGVFPETAGSIHSVVSFITFFFGGLSAIASYRLQKSPLSSFAVLLGVMTLVALALFISGIYLGLGNGGMERMIAYPALLWAVGFSGHLLAYTKETRAKR